METISDVQALADQPGLNGPVASTATIRRVLEGVDADLLGELRLVRARARERAWAARGGLTGVELPPARAAGRDLHYAVIDLDATLVTAHSRKEGAAGNFKGGFGCHPIGSWLDNTGEAVAAILRPGNAGSNTAPTTSRCSTWPWRSCPMPKASCPATSRTLPPRRPWPHRCRPVR